MYKKKYIQKLPPIFQHRKWDKTMPCGFKPIIHWSEIFNPKYYQDTKFGCWKVKSSELRYAFTKMLSRHCLFYLRIPMHNQITSPLESEPKHHQCTFSENVLVMFWLVFQTKALSQVIKKRIDSALVVHWMYLGSFLFHMGIQPFPLRIII